MVMLSKGSAKDCAWGCMQDVYALLKLVAPVPWWDLKLVLNFFRIDMALASFSLALIVTKSASVSHQAVIRLVPDSPNLFIHVYYVETEQRRGHDNLQCRCP